MNEIKFFDDQLILREKYNESNIILTAHFSQSFEKNLRHNKIVETEEEIIDFHNGRKKVEKMLSKYQNNIIKLNQTDDKVKYNRDQKIIFRKFFKICPKIKEIMAYNDSVDLLRLSYHIKTKEEDWRKKLRKSFL